MNMGIQNTNVRKAGRSHTEYYYSQYLQPCVVLLFDGEQIHLFRPSPGCNRKVLSRALVQVVFMLAHFSKLHPFLAPHFRPFLLAKPVSNLNLRMTMASQGSNDRSNLIPFSSRLKEGRALALDVWTIFRWVIGHYLQTINGLDLTPDCGQRGQLAGRLYQSWTRVHELCPS